MKLLAFEDRDEPVLDPAYANISVEIFDEKGILFKVYKEEILDMENSKISFLLGHLNQGDSCIFKVSTDKIKEAFKPSLFTKTNQKFVDVVVKVHRFYRESEYLALKSTFDKEMMEQLLLSKYLEEFSAEKQNGIYKTELVKGAGEYVKIGDEITIAYRGCFINRLAFDHISGNTAFSFTYGTPGQVIKGLDIAIKSMREGEKSKIIIPSHLAFGEEGSTTLIVPSFTTVIYELEILKIN